MEVSAIAAVATDMAQAKAAQEVSIAVLKKALAAQASSAQALLQALPPVSTAKLPPHLGQTINTTA